MSLWQFCRLAHDFEMRTILSLIYLSQLSLKSVVSFIYLWFFFACGFFLARLLFTIVTVWWILNSLKLNSLCCCANHFRCLRFKCGNMRGWKEMMFTSSKILIKWKQNCHCCNQFLDGISLSYVFDSIIIWLAESHQSICGFRRVIDFNGNKWLCCAKTRHKYCERKTLK